MSTLDVSTMKPCGLGCPRCGCGLVENEPDARWCRWFECIERIAVWHFLAGKLHAGRIPRPAGAR